MKRSPRWALAALPIMLAFDLIWFPNCVPNNSPDHGPALLDKGDMEHRIGLQLHLGAYPNGNTRFGLHALDWTYALRTGLGGGREIGARALMGLGIVLPNGLEGEYAFNTGRLGDNASALRLSLGWHFVDWSKYFMGKDGSADIGFAVWNLTSSLAIGSNRFYAGPILSLSMHWPDFETMAGEWTGGDFGPGPRLEGMALFGRGGYRLGLTTSGRTGN
jgi:hypothetical protein